MTKLLEATINDGKLKLKILSEDQTSEFTKGKYRIIRNFSQALQLAKIEYH